MRKTIHQGDLEQIEVQDEVIHDVVEEIVELRSKLKAGIEALEKTQRWWCRAHCQKNPQMVRRKSHSILCQQMLTAIEEMKGESND